MPFASIVTPLRFCVVARHIRQFTYNADRSTVDDPCVSRCQHSRMTKIRNAAAMRRATVGALIVGACGIGLLWAGGLTFPVVPPGIAIFLVGAVFVAVAPWRWAPA